MARRPLEGWDVAHNKHSLHGASAKDQRRRRQRRLLRAALRGMVTGVPSSPFPVPRGIGAARGQRTS
jgi:hypothetical protein